MQSFQRHDRRGCLVLVRVPVMPRAGGGRAAGVAWMSRGACQREDPELFFPVELTGAESLRRISAAKAVCGRCPVRRSCLSYALKTAQDGIWGGTTPDERYAMRRPAARRGSGQRGSTVTAGAGAAPVPQAARQRGVAAGAP
jgi:WhiB family redox-sensing transcriptional regulator